MNGLIATNVENFPPGFPGDLAEKYYMVPDGQYPYVHSGAPVLRGLGEYDPMNTALGLVVVAATGWILWRLTR